MAAEPSINFSTALTRPPTPCFARRTVASFSPLHVVPQNAYRCSRTAIGEWRCSSCTERSSRMTMERVDKALDAMPSVATLLRKWTVVVRPDEEQWTGWLLRRPTYPQHVVIRSIPLPFVSMLGLEREQLKLIKWSPACPIENCGARGMGVATSQSHELCRMCLECKAVFAAMKFISTFLRTGSGGKRISFPGDAIPPY